MLRAYSNHIRITFESNSEHILAMLALLFALLALPTASGAGTGYRHYDSLGGQPFKVGYTKRALTINDEVRLGLVCLQDLPA